MGINISFQTKINCTCIANASTNFGRHFAIDLWKIIKWKLGQYFYSVAECAFTLHKWLGSLGASSNLERKYAAKLSKISVWSPITNRRTNKLNFKWCVEYYFSYILLFCRFNLAGRNCCWIVSFGLNQENSSKLYFVRCKNRSRK